MTLSAEVIDFIRLDIINNVSKLACVGQVPIMEKHFCGRIMRVNVYMLYPSGIKGTGSSNKSMDLVSF